MSAYEEAPPCTIERYDGDRSKARSDPKPEVEIGVRIEAEGEAHEREVSDGSS